MGNVVGAFVFVFVAGFWIVPSPMLEFRYDRVMWGTMNGALLCCIGPIAYAFIIGLVMLNKIEQHHDENDIDNTPTRPEQNESSVWDDAI